MGGTSVWQRIRRAFGGITAPTPFDSARASLQNGQLEEALLTCRAEIFRTLTVLAHTARLPIPQVRDQDERAYALNDTLATHGVYALPMSEQIRRWIGLGQLAQDGALDEVTQGEISALISGLEGFTRIVAVTLDAAQAQPFSFDDAIATTNHVAQGSRPPVHRPLVPPPPPPQRLRELSTPVIPIRFADEQAPSVFSSLTRVPGFVGRGHSVMRLGGLLRQKRHTALVPMEAGIAGSGLSAVMTETLWLLEQDSQSAFPGGILALNGFGRQGEPALRWIYSAIGANWKTPAIAQATSLGQQEREVRRALLDRQVLIAIDQVETGLPTQRLLDSLEAAGATVLLVSRQTPRAEQLGVMRLESLSAAPALTLLQDRFVAAGGNIADWDDLPGRTLCTLLDHRPLALELVAPIAARSSLPALAQRLAIANERGLIRNASDPNQALRYLMDLALQGLSGSAHNAFAALAIFAGPTWAEDAGLAVLSAVEASLDPAGSYPPSPQGTLQELTQRRLLDMTTSPHSGRRYRMQTYIRSAAARLLLDRPVMMDDAGNRMAAFYAGFALTRRKASDDLVMQEDYIHLEAGLTWAHTHHDPELVVSYGMGLYRYWQRQGLWLEAEQYLGWAVQAAKTIGDRPREAQLAQELATALMRLNQKAHALEWFDVALATWRQLGNSRSEAVVLFDLGRLAQEDNDLTAARAYYHDSLTASQQAADEQGQGRALQALGLIAESQGQFEEARRCYELVFAMRQEAHDAVGQAGALNVLGVLEFRLHHYAAARDLLTASLNCALDASNDFWEAEARFWLGEALLALGSPNDATLHWQRALQLYTRQGRTSDVDEVRRRLTRMATRPPI